MEDLVSTEPGQSTRWFWASILLKCIPKGRRRRRHLWQQIVFVVNAADEAEAQTKIRAIAENKQHAYTSASGQALTWELQQVEEVQSLIDSEISDGTEVYWRFFERIDPAG